VNGREPPVPPRGAAAPAIGPGSTPAPGPGPSAAAGRAGSLLAVHTAVFLFGISGLLGKMVDTPPLVIVFARAFLAALVLGALVILRAGGRPRLSRRDLLLLGITGAILAAHWFSFFQSIRVSTVAIGLLAYSTFPIFVTFLEPLFFPERLRGRDAALAAVVAAGLVLVIPDYSIAGSAMQGALWGVASGLTFAILAVMNRRSVRSLSPLVIGAGQNAAAALVLAPWIALAPPSLSVRDLVILLALGVFCTALAHVLFIRGLSRVRARTASVIAALEPVYGILLALAILREAPAPRTIAGGAIIIACAMLAGLREAGDGSGPRQSL